MLSGMGIRISIFLSHHLTFFRISHLRKGPTIHVQDIEIDIHFNSIILDMKVSKVVRINRCTCT